MNRIHYRLKSFVIKVIAVILLFSCNQKTIKIYDENGILSETNAPVKIELKLSKKQKSAAEEGSLFLFVTSTKALIPVQPERMENSSKSNVVLILPVGISGDQDFKLIEKESPEDKGLETSVDAQTGQVIIEEAGQMVLQYNYQTVYEKDVVRPESKKGTDLHFSNMSGVYYDEYLKSHPDLQKNDTTTSSIYSVPRSDYIHPLYGLEDEMLTSDWPDGGHPHHRGIFWAWPEVEFGTQRGDIYALQRVFTRPTGNINFESGPVFAQIDAENLWMWEDSVPIVNEQAKIRVYRSNKESRIIDLTIKLLALKDSVTIATRFTNSYGGLNIRMQTPENQDISYFTDKNDSNPVRAWSDFNGVFEGSKTASGLMVLQHKSNPGYPGEWREYPDLAWVQPTFPTPNTRFPLSKVEPLILHYRLIIHSGGKQKVDYYRKNWDAYHSVLTPPLVL